MQRSPLKSVAFIVNGVKHELDEAQVAKLNKWLADLADKIDEKHRRAGKEFLVERFKSEGKVYVGVSGGNLTYLITPTSIGTVFNVSDSITGENIDLTDYDNW